MPRATTAAWLVMPPRVVRMPLRGVHAVDVLGAGLDAHQDDRLAAAGAAASASSAENTTLPEAAPGEAGRPRASTFVLRLRVERRVQQLVERIGLDAADRLVAVDDALLDHDDRDLQRRRRGALAGARLQHPQLAALRR